MKSILTELKLYSVKCLEHFISKLSLVTLLFSMASTSNLVICFSIARSQTHNSLSTLLSLNVQAICFATLSSIGRNMEQKCIKLLFGIAGNTSSQKKLSMVQLLNLKSFSALFGDCREFARQLLLLILLKERSIQDARFALTSELYCWRACQSHPQYDEGKGQTKQDIIALMNKA